MPGPPRSRRAVLLGGAAGMAVLGGCGEEEPPAAQGTSSGQPRHQAPRSVLTLPDADAKALMVLVHGGGWLAGGAGAGPGQLTWLTEGLAKVGVATWNVAYRGLDTGGGWPATFEDVAAAFDEVPRLLRKHPRLRGLRTTALGHSAGAHLAVWAASRTGDTPGGEPAWLPDSVVSMSGPLMLTRCALEGGDLGHAITLLMGGTPNQVPRHYVLGDPGLMTPLVPIHTVHARQDPIVPVWNSTEYVTAARDSGGRADLTLIDGNHASTLDANLPDWPRVQAVLDRALGF